MTSICQAADPWSERDKYLEATYFVFHLTDWAQTRDIESRSNEGYYETNKVLGKHPSLDQVNGYFIATGLLHLGIVHLLPKEYRPWFQIITIGVEVGCDVHNYSAGVRLKF